MQTAGAAAILMAVAGGLLTMPLTTASSDGLTEPGVNDTVDSWAPAPEQPDGLTTVATADGRGLRLLTRGGTRDFVAGVDLGATTPGHLPGEVAVSDTDYRRWFAQMASLGIRVVRIYTIHPPGFYRELAAYNKANPAAPLYLVQGVYLPDEGYVVAGHTLYDERVDDAFAAEIEDATLAVRGALHRDEAPGRAFGDWDADVTPWLMAWLLGVEWDPQTTARTDREHADAPSVDGPYFRSAPQASPTERWLAGHMNALAGIEARNGRSLPVAFVNWPSTDPLSHPDEPHPGEDLVGIDANHVLPTLAWPGGTFASYHAYPYYPDFLRYEKALQATVVDGRPDPYAGYLASLKKHHEGMPVLITELGVPSSLGKAHDGPLGRDQGGLSEKEAMATDADLMRTVHDQGLSGAFLFSWSDEWFKLTWNTVEHQIPAQNRPLWHDPLTNEQYFGLLATDPNPLDGARRVLRPADGTGVAELQLDADASYLYLDVVYGSSAGNSPATAPLTLAVDTVPGGAPTPESGGGVDAADYRIEVDPAEVTGQAFVRAGLDVARFDTWEDLPEAGSPWHPYRLITNRSYDGEHSSSLETQNVGLLQRGAWQVDADEPNSLATWQTVGDTVRLRIPWPLLGLTDPSSRTALTEGSAPAVQVIEDLGLTVSVAGGTPVTLRYSWPTWDTPSGVGHTERLKTGIDVVAETFRELND